MALPEETQNDDEDDDDDDDTLNCPVLHISTL